MKKVTFNFIIIVFGYSGYSNPPINDSLTLSESARHLKFVHPFNPNAESLILSGGVRESNFTGQGYQTSFGLNAEYFITGNISVRGGLMVSQDYTKLTPAPLMWYLADRLLSPSNSEGHSGGGYHGGGSHGCSGGGFHGGRGCCPAALYILASFIISDGFAYNIPIEKNLHFTPYFTPWELVFSNQDGSLDNISAVGAGFTYSPSKHLMFEANAEYDRTSLLADSKEGYSANISLGYRFFKNR